MRKRLRPAVSLLVALLVAFPGTSHASLCERAETARQRIAELKDVVSDAEITSDEVSARLDEARAAAAAAPNNAIAIQQIEFDIDAIRTRASAAEREVQVAEYEADPARLSEIDARLAAQRSARDAAERALEAAQSARARIDADPAVAAARQRADAETRAVRSVIGAAAVVDDTQALSKKLEDGWPGERHSALWASYQVLARTDLTANVVILSDGTALDPHSDAGGFVQRREQLQKIIDDRLKGVRASLSRLDAARVQVADAERRVEQGMSAQDRASVKTIPSLQAALATAEKELTAAEEAHASTQADMTRAGGRLPEYRRELDSVRQELAAAEAKLTAERAKTSPEEQRVEELTARLADVDARFFQATDRLVRSELELEGLQAELAKVEADVKQRVADGNTLGSQGFQAGKAGDKALCLEQLAAARAQFSAAYSLALGNAACVPGLKSQLGTIEGRLDRTERAPCDGETLDPDPRDGRVAVPAVMHLPLPDARQAIQAAGLTVAAIEYLSPPDRASAGLISQQDPAPATRLEAGETVTVWHYGNLRTVPSVTGADIEEADSVLAQNGLFGNRVAGTPAPAPDQVGKVYQQNPAAGAQVLPGETITVAFHTDPASGGGTSGFTAAGPPSGSTGTGGASGSGGSSGTGPGGFTAAGQPTTTAGPSGSPPPPAPAPDPARDAAVRRIQQAWGACDLDRALQLADFLAGEVPGDPWIAANYGRLIDEKRARDAALSMLRQAQAYLGKSNPSDADVDAAIQATERAQSLAPSCMSQSVSRLRPQIQATAQAVRAADAAARRQATGGFLSALTGVVATVAGVTGRIPPDMAAEVAGLTGMPAAATAAVEEIAEAVSGGGSGGGTGGGSSTPQGGGGGGGSSSGGGGGSGAAPQCDYCVTSDYNQLGATGRLNYLFGTRHEFPVPSCPGGVGRARAFMLIPISPEDDEGRPLNHWPGASAFQRTVPNSFSVCGPCGTAAQARAVMKRHCPNPAVDTQGILQRFPQIRNSGGG